MKIVTKKRSTKFFFKVLMAGVVSLTFSVAHQWIAYGVSIQDQVSSLSLRPAALEAQAKTVLPATDRSTALPGQRKPASVTRSPIQ
ncbi:MAG: hypothetical protein AB7F86_17250 [Bdellovibrionales bacterium]